MARRVIAIANQKGGVGKTTTAVNLSAALAECGKSVLLLDLDPQGNATTGLGLRKQELEATLFEAFTGRSSLKDAIYETYHPNLSIAPVNLNMVGLQIMMVSMEDREYRLRQLLAPLEDDYDYIIMDCPPSLALLTINAAVACDCVLIPLQCEFYALEGVAQLMQTISLVRRLYNPKIELEGVLLTMHSHTTLGQQVVEEAQKYFGDKVFSVSIPRNVRLAEAPSHGQPISVYDNRCPGAHSYHNLAKKIIENKKAVLSHGS